MNTLTAPAEVEREDRFRALYHATYPDLLRFVERRVHPSHAEDVAAEVYLAAWRRVDDVPTPPEMARAWVFGVARRVLQNSRRGQERHAALAVRVAETAPSTTAGDDPDLVARRLDLAAAWPRLSATDQEALALVAWDGLSTAEAATVLDISARTVTASVANGRFAAWWPAGKDRIDNPEISGAVILDATLRDGTTIRVP